MYRKIGFLTSVQISHCGQEETTVWGHLWGHCVLATVCILFMLVVEMEQETVGENLKWEVDRKYIWWKHTPVISVSGSWSGKIVMSSLHGNTGVSVDYKERLYLTHQAGGREEKEYDKPEIGTSIACSSMTLNERDYRRALRKKIIKTLFKETGPICSRQTTLWHQDMLVRLTLRPP